MSHPKYTVHDVLAGAYAGKNPRLDSTLSHLSADGGDTALCGRVRPGHLADIGPTEPTCSRCIARRARDEVPARMRPGFIAIEDLPSPPSASRAAPAAPMAPGFIAIEDLSDEEEG